MKKSLMLMMCVMLCLIMVGSALADQSVTLPGDRYSVTLPDGMQYSPQNPSDRNQSPYFQFAYFSGSLEMDVFAYDNGGVTLAGLAESMRSQGHTVTIQQINGMDTLCYSGVVDASGDGAACIGYVIMDGNQVVEIAFWYANQQGMDTATEIMNSLR